MGSASKVGSNNQDSGNASSSLVIAAISSTLATLAVGSVLYQNHRARVKRQERAKLILKEIEEQKSQGPDTSSLPSIISHFSDFQIDATATVEEANKRRTTKYYELARDAHMYDLVPGIRSYPRLRNIREEEMKRIFRYRGTNKSHRTVLVMCDEVTSQMLYEARNHILQPLRYSHDITTSKAWIPEASVLPKEHLHVTVSIPWWWHGIRDGNEQLSQELVARFRQALVLEFHHAFQVELERIVLLGGKTLVALWRCVGEREAPDDFIIFDRHGEGQDPMVKLRRDIVECFTSEGNKFGQEPLTYSYRHYEENSPKTPSHTTISTTTSNGTTTTTLPPPPPARKLERQNTIEWKTPGLGDADGFIHTTLARLPIDCLSMTDVELAPIHRLCREATATYSGHRMVVSKFRFLETTGKGGESNPCVDPIFDENVQAPPRVGVGLTGEIQQTIDLHTSKIVERNATIGNLPPRHKPKNSMDGLFDVPTIDYAKRGRAASFGTESDHSSSTAPTNPQRLEAAIDWRAGE